MTISLSPPPDQLGHSSPALGPWFSTAPTIGAPADDLSATVTLTAGTHWLAPAPGLLSVFAGGAAAPEIATLKNAHGDYPFASGQIAGVVRLLPEVEERLEQLARFLPPVDAAPPSAPPATPSTVPTRPRVRTIALVLPSAVVSAATSPVAALWPLIPPPAAPPTLDSDDASHAAYLGLSFTGGTLGNDRVPMTDLRLPVGGATGQEKLLQNLPAGDYTLWAFDARGNAIDPGAVAAWWSYLAQAVFSNLWVTGATSTTPTGVACATADQLTVQLVNPHEGALAAPLLDGRLTLSNATTGTGVVRRASGTWPLGFAFGAAGDPAVDDAPIPRVAVLPSGTYAATLSLWPSGPVGTVVTGAPLLRRDFVRVAAVDVERHLVGQARGPVATTTTPGDRRAGDQNRVSTRILVGRASNTDVLAPTIEAATQGVLGVFDAGGPRRIIAPTLDRAWGALAFDPASFASSAALPDVALPTQLNDDGTTTPWYAAHPLAGGALHAVDGSGHDTRPPRQRVLIELAFDAAFAGAWVRVWPEGFDDQIGVHTRMNGGGGRVGADGKAYVVATLPDTTSSGAAAPTAVNLMLVTARGSRLYADKRFARPIVPSPDTPATLGSGTAWTICETGEHGTGGSLGRFVGGMTVIVDQGGGSWALVSPASLAVADLAPATIGSKLRAGDLIELTRPAFKATPDRLYGNGDPAPVVPAIGDPAADDPITALAALGATVDRCLRTTPPLPGSPLPTLDRLEVVVSGWDASHTSAAIATAPPLSPYHELLPHELGHPGAPGAVEVHGTGVRVEGPAALGLLELTRDRSAGLGASWWASVPAAVQPLLARTTAMLAVEAALTLLPTPAAPTAAGLWTAALRTVAAGVEGELGGAQGLIRAGLYPFSDDVARINTWITGTVLPQLASLPGNVSTQIQNALNAIHPNEDAVARALDRRVKASAFGLREAAFSLAAAFGRAEELIYLETAALDHTTLGPTGTDGDPLDLFAALLARATTRPGLRILVCVPLHLLPGTPRMLEDVRNANLLDALGELARALGEDRFAVFYPAAHTGRSTRLSSTSVIVDDAYALTGTTHLWRRGLCFDSSVAAAAFDERLDHGRPQAIRAFRRRLVAGRLGVSLAQLPDDPVELVRAVNTLVTGGSGRLVPGPSQPQPFRPPGVGDDHLVNDYPTQLPPPAAGTPPTAGITSFDRDVWNPNGADTTVTAVALLAALGRSTAATDASATIASDDWRASAVTAVA